MKYFILIVLLAVAVVLAIPKKTQSLTDNVLYITPEQYLDVVYNDPVFTCLARYESGFKEKAANPNSSAKGFFQIIDGTFEHYGQQYWGTTEGKDVLNGVHNADLAFYIYTTSGIQHWEVRDLCL